MITTVTLHFVRDIECIEGGRQDVGVVCIVDECGASD